MEDATIKLKKESKKLFNLGQFNILLGKNGSGKSRLLRNIYEEHSNNSEFNISYIAPERGGHLNLNPPLLQSAENNELEAFQSGRQRNYVNNMRDQATALYCNLERLFLRERGRQHFEEKCIRPINSLLDRIKLVQNTGCRSGFLIHSKNGENVDLSYASSGEKELISLAIECIYFAKISSDEKISLLLLDEPDVHLHPDAQAKFATFLTKLISPIKNIRVIIATHSTALLSALHSCENENTKVAFLKPEQNELIFKEILPIYKKILPVFGAHPLTNTFNEKPILLLEGEDDERIWQQAVRTANTKLLLYPCSVGGKDELRKQEREIDKLLISIYESAKAYSIRDLDDNKTSDAYGSHELKILKPFRLECRASENLLLSDETLETLGTTWEKLTNEIKLWVKSKEEIKEQNCYFYEMSQFQKEKFPRKNFDLKNIRNLLMSLVEKNFTWEAAIGKTLGKLAKEKNIQVQPKSHSIFNYLGKEIASKFFPNVQFMKKNNGINKETGHPLISET